MENGKPRVAVFKFSSCSGCQLAILNLEDEILDLVGAVEIAYFLEARRMPESRPYDISFIEGSITTQEEVDRIKQIREDSGLLIALGSCATAGGVQTLKNYKDVNHLIDVVYEHPEYIETLDKSTPISEHVNVDFELWGCPVDKYQIVEAVSALLQNRQPNLPQHSLCLECKALGRVCVTVASGTPCLGPITKAGCGAVCPSVERGCYGCFGPSKDLDLDAFIPVLRENTDSGEEAVQLIRTICGYAPEFEKAAQMILAEEVVHE
jgi:sulfhydrogenase subunit delta